MNCIDYDPGIGQAVANRSINRIINGKTETWKDVCDRVSVGNVGLLNLIDAPKSIGTQQNELDVLRKHMYSGTILMSGRHLQHGDENQITRPGEVFTNCSTSATSFFLFYLLLNGSGVGRSYDDDMMLVNWGKYLPVVVPTIRADHPDVLSGEIQIFDTEDVKKFYGSAKKMIWYNVPDSREGWASAIELIETLTFGKDDKNTVVVLDFSGVRCRNSPIAGMQGRPASGPGPLISAIENIIKLRKSGLLPWQATMCVDHFLAECVLVGGARRAARMATKHWTDSTILDFINVKRNTEFAGKSGEEIAEMRSSGYYKASLWSANDSVVVTKEFWKSIDKDAVSKEISDSIIKSAYYDGTGEPGYINGDLLSVGPKRDIKLRINPLSYTLLDDTKYYLHSLELRHKKAKTRFIVNPCGEIVLSSLGAYCVIADVAPYFSNSLDDAENAFRAAARALIRTNLMRFAYDNEVKITNRIGVGITGFHEWAWKFFGHSWKEIIDENKSFDLWMTLSRFKRAVNEECEWYSKELGVVTPHTNTTIKPAGTTSKLFALSEGVHLPAMREYLRWVQFRNDDPKVTEYKKLGYPVRELTTYRGTTIVGFPTQPLICKLGLNDKLVIASEATPEEQYQFLRLLEKYWIRGVDESGAVLEVDTGNQISYTLKYDPKAVSFEEFQKIIIDNQGTVKCCSVLPREESSSYEYLPEESITIHEYNMIVEQIESGGIDEDVGVEHVDCATGACPISWKEEETNAK